MSVCMCVSTVEGIKITSGVIETPYDWLNKLYSCYMAAVVGIISGRGLSTDARGGN